MPLYNTNIFPIKNLHELTAYYRLYTIFGLSETSEEYDSNVQFIIKKLSFQLGQPITVVPRSDKSGEKLYLVIKDDPVVLAQVPEEFEVKKKETVFFQPTEQVLKLDFVNYDESTREICRRFLQFDLNSEVQRHRDLWQPRAGQAFFSKAVYDGNHQVAIYNGFLPRIVELPKRGWGVSIEITNKYAKVSPESAYLTREEFNRLKDKDSHFIYHYGHLWYEVQPQEWSDINAATYQFRREPGAELTTVIADLHRQAGTSMPPEIANLPDDVSLLIYRNNRGEERRIPAGLCYRVLDTDDPLVGKLHQKSIIPPFYRRRKAHIVRKRYLTKLRFGKVNLEIDETPIQVEKRVFNFPDLEFANGTILSVKNTTGALQVTLEGMGKRRKQLVREVGCYVTNPFERQYIVLPESLANSFGRTQFLKHLQQEVDKMHPTEEGWIPDVITYNDRNTKDSLALGMEILTQLRKVVNDRVGGYALIVIPDLNRKKRTQDDLATLCVKEGATLFNLEVSIMHTDTITSCFEYRNQGGYRLKEVKQGLYRGYVHGVALNKVILNNERWPFILKTPLSADLYIGIDVKHSLAGFTFISKQSDSIKPVRQPTKQKEQLSSDQIRTTLIKQIRKLADYQEIHSIVIHRDGRFFRTEFVGTQQAIEELIKEGKLPQDVALTIVELPKNSTTALRLFEEVEPYDITQTPIDNGSVLNPQIGSWVAINDREGFVCTTGREFVHKGTTLPLYVKISYGEMPLERVLEDIYYLSTLAYSKLDDCSRDPLTIKMTDRRINEFGGKYDSDRFDLLKQLELD